MSLETSSIRILFFIGSLRPGGKERRLVELLTFLKANNRYELLLVLTKNEIHYQQFYDLNINYQVLKNSSKKSKLSVFYQFYKLCKQFKPHVIHTWGRVQTLYTLPAVIAQDIPLVNSQIAGAPVHISKYSSLSLIDRLNFKFSKKILANSQAGIATYKPPKSRQQVIYNGIHLNRFQNLPSTESIKAKYGIHTPYAVIMVGSYTMYKDYDLFYKIAETITCLRDDISFIGVGGIDKDDAEFKRLKTLSQQNEQIQFLGKINEVEALVNACDIGVLFSPNGEGISNAILEYMALSKAVIATDTGGNKELIQPNKNGYLVHPKATVKDIVPLILELIDNVEKRLAFGVANQKVILESFSISKMGKAFEHVYEEALT